MEGTFALLGPLDLLQLLARGGKKGVFQTLAPSGKGAVYLHGSRVTHAHWGGVVGEEAMMRVLLLKEGRFRFIEGAEADEVTLERDLDHYLLQAIRRLDDRVEVSPFDRVKFGQGGRVGHLTLNPDELALFTHLSKPISVLDLAVASEKPLRTVMTTLGHLARLGVIEVEHRAPHTARLTLAIKDPLPPYAHVDELLLSTWRLHYGRFDHVHVRVDNRTLKLPVRGAENLGGLLLLGTGQLIMHELSAGQTLMVWPALPGAAGA
ncbi:DUF4388 domain-containing protein [Oceanithermus sp.]|uniref:DUF4388 domain-containing protein n=1 Tax=Oceanithermus sp. TaxID=2268145 RepID=UPI00257F590A|nr:DUF4388 domain-containing protein [Oceanithermus sp.]